MNDLDQARSAINRIDKEMAALFEERMKAAEIIANFKKENGLSVKDNKREAELIAKNRSYIQDEIIESYYVQFLRKIIDLSCDYQTRCMTDLKVAYSGVEGAYAYIAAKRMFPTSQLIAYPNFQAAYKAAEVGEADCVVLPFENSYAGEVGPVMDLLFSGNLYVNQVLDLEIVHNLLAVKGADVSKIKTVVTHPQALEQCGEYIAKHGFETLSYSNTAAAAKFVKEKNDPTIAAIASDETADIFGLEILESRVNTSNSNTTRFGAFTTIQHRIAPAVNNSNERFILMFNIKNEPNSLAKTLDIIGAHRFNMISLRSRPMKDLNWSYYFYVECEGNVESDEGKSMLRALSAMCEKVKLVGSFYKA